MLQEGVCYTSIRFREVKQVGTLLHDSLSIDLKILPQTKCGIFVTLVNSLYFNVLMK